MISQTAIVSEFAIVDESATIWHFSHIREESRLGKNVIVGEFVYIDKGVSIGDDCKIQNGAKIYSPAILDSGVFIGPNVVLTNDKYPRSINQDGGQKNGDDWVSVGVEIGQGASVGAQSTCVAPVRIGNWSMIAAGSVVTKDVPDFALVAGVPARFVHWVGKSGHKLIKHSNTIWKCPVSSNNFFLNENGRLEMSDV